MRRHEIPTHLDVPDTVFLGLTAGQALQLVLGLAAAYAAWDRWPDLAPGARLGLAAACVLAAAVLALVRPGRRGLAEWALVVLRYHLRPRRSVWRPAEPDPADWRAPA